MSRGTTLLNIRTFLKAEIGDYAGTNTVRDGELNARISNEQRRLGAEFNWSFLERRYDVTVSAGQQYPTLPTVTAGDPETVSLALNLNREPRVEVLWVHKFNPVEYGIGMEQYNVLNAAYGETSDPIQRWRVATDTNEPNNANAFEVWPVPTTPQLLRFTGQRSLQTLASDGDTADLDDMLLVYFVAANILAKEGGKDAQIMMAKAQRLFQILKQQDQQKDKVRCLGGGNSKESDRNVKLIGIAAAH